MSPSDANLLSLNLSTDGVSLVSATEALDVPGWCARRCQLIEDLASVNHGKDVNLPLPLASSELKAWLECAQQVKTVFDPGTSPLNMDDDKLINALKVRHLYWRPSSNMTQLFCTFHLFVRCERDAICHFHRICLLCRETVIETATSSNRTCETASNIMKFPFLRHASPSTCHYCLYGHNKTKHIFITCPCREQTFSATQQPKQPSRGLSCWRCWTIRFLCQARCQRRSVQGRPGCSLLLLHTFAGFANAFARSSKRILNADQGVIVRPKHRNELPPISATPRTPVTMLHDYAV